MLAAVGIGGAVGSMVVASLKLPRRYLTVMNLLWAFGCLPLVVFGLTDQIWVMAIAAFAVGAAYNGGVVIWGTLLQRWVPRPCSAGSRASTSSSRSRSCRCRWRSPPAGESLGLPVVFLLAGIAPPVIGVVAIIAARMTRDEIAHPLEASEDASADAAAAEEFSLESDAAELARSSAREHAVSAA